MEDFDKFLYEAGKAIATEEAKKLVDNEVLQDIENLMETWAETLGTRIQERMHALGLDQELTINVEWSPLDPPKFHISGKTYPLDGG